MTACAKPGCGREATRIVDGVEVCKWHIDAAAVVPLTPCRAPGCGGPATGHGAYPNRCASHQSYLPAIDGESLPLRLVGHITCTRKRIESANGAIDTGQ